ncbi:MAG: NTP transferase domain-containing protein [Candidatus Omnitrophica bacterium]|nr:NTP transferase domain-containing protein [Candidatus Omnitrophota bacterium]
MSEEVRGIVLAAGKGERMKSCWPKLSHPLCGRPIICYPIEILKKAGIKKIIVVVGYKKELLFPYLKGTQIVVQKKLSGTGDALLAVEPSLPNFRGTLLVVSGDVPLIREETLRKLLKEHRRTNAFATILVTVMENPSGYGRIFRSEDKQVIKICEETDLKEGEKIREVNSGIYCFQSPLVFGYLKKIKLNPHKKEYYLTDVIALGAERGERISTFFADSQEVLGINTREDLSRAEKIMRMRIMNEIMGKGVTIVDPENTYIEEGVKIGQDTIIFPFTIIEREVSIGKNCRIGPFCRIREKTVIADNVELGNFVELVRSKVGEFSKAKHLTYLGDTSVGREVNIGAGTVVANFDGKKKHKTVIAEKAFIGTGTILIAPVKVGREAITGAGAVVTKNSDVPPGKTVVGVPARILNKIGS